MWQHWSACRAARRPVTGADLDRVFGTNNYGRRVINDWVLAGRITSADVAAARAGLTPATGDRCLYRAKQAGRNRIHIDR